MVFDPSIIADAKKLTLTQDGTDVDANLTDFSLTVIPPPTWTGYSALAEDIHANTVLLIESFNQPDGNTTFVDSSTTGRTVTVGNNTKHSTTQSKFSTSSIKFDGADDYLSVPDSSDWDFGTGDFYVSTWVNFSSIASVQTIFSHYLNSSTGWTFQFINDAGNNLVFGHGDTQLISRSWTPTVGTWYHIAVNRSGTNLRLWVNGTQLGATATNSTNITGGTYAFSIGCLYSGGFIQDLNGYLQSIQIIKGAALYTTTFTPPNRLFSVPAYKKISIDISGTQCPIEVSPNEWEDWLAPTNHYTMDDITGSTLTDEMGDTDGTITNMTQTAGGPFDNYLAGGSITSTIRNVDYGAGGVAFKSISFWVKRITTNQVELLFKTPTGNKLFYIRSNSTLSIFNGSSELSSSLNITDNTTWHHVVITEGSTTNYHWYYLDRVKAAAEVNGTFGDVFRYIGSEATASSQNVSNIDNVQIYDTVLTDAQIARLYAAQSQYYHPGRQAVLHTKIPSILAASGFEAVLSYDETQDDNDTYVGLTGETVAQSVWDSNFVAVYHMAQDPSGGTGCILDSTSNANHGTPAGTMLTEDLVDANIGKGLDLEGTDDKIVIADDATLQFGTGDYTLEVFFKADVVSYGASDQGILISKDYTGFEIAVYSGDLDGYAAGTLIDGPVISTGTWYHGAHIRNSGTVTPYLNASAGSGVSASGSVSEIGDPVTIGERLSGSFYFNGIISEVRISSTARSDAWIKATNLCLTDAFLTWSAYSAGGSAFFSGSTGTIPPPVIIKNLIDLNYDLMASLRNSVDLVYSIKLAAMVDLLYGDLLPVRQRVDLLYDLKWKIAQKVDLKYGDMAIFRQAVDILYDMRGEIRNKVDLKYHLIQEQLTQMIDLPYDLQLRDEVRQVVNIIYAILTEATIEESTNLLVVIPGTIPVRGYTLAATDGYNITPFSVDIEKDESNRFINVEILTYLEDDFENCPVGTNISVQVNSDVYVVKVRKRLDRMDRRTPHYSLICDSAGFLLGFPHAAPVNGELTGMAQTIVNNLVDLEDSAMTVSWTLVDWLIPPDTLTAENQSPLDLIEQIVEAAGGVVQFDKDGNMECRPLFPVNLWDIDDDTKTTVATTYNALDDLYEVSYGVERRDGFNNFLISNQTITADGLQIAEVEDITDYIKRVKVTQLPFAADTVRLMTSGGAWVQVVNEGIRTEIIGNGLDVDGKTDEDDTPELVELVDGTGQTRMPIYALNSYRWRETSLGTIGSGNWDEDGTITAADTSSNSQIEVVYTTKYYSFKVINNRMETVQFWPEII